MSDPETLKVYAEKAQEYADLTDEDNHDDPLLDAFIADVRQGGRVLDLGCGPGASAARMAQKGLRVDAFDPVPEMVQLAGRHAGVDAKEAGFEDVSGADLYDGIWANFSLLHASKDDLPAHLARIAAALKPGGIFHIAVKSGTGTARDSLGRRYTYYSDQELTALLTDAGMTVFDKQTGEGKGLAGDTSSWIAMRARA